MQNQQSRSFRLVCGSEQVPLVEALLHAQGFSFEPEPFYPLARRLTGGPIPLGSSLAAVFGYIYIQDRSSMLPPLALAPAPGAAVLDMCASPGSKTGLLAAISGGTGFILGNEPSPKRLGTLRRNLKQQNLLSCATCSYPGERMPLPDAGQDYPGWEYIQLDPPCSGWGTVEKNPQVMRLWQGDKLKVLVSLQRRLLSEAARLLSSGGRLVYSTCTTNVQENEEQVAYARDVLGLEPLCLEPIRGFNLAPAVQGCDGVWRVDTGPDGQGFFVALLRKPQAGSGYAPTPGPAYSRDWEYLPESALAGDWADASRLPPGCMALFKDVAHFIPKKALTLLPEDFAWKGFPLGRVDKSGGLRVDPHLRSLMPSLDEARKRGLAYVEIEEPEPVLGLLSGRSLDMDGGSSEAGLYFQGLPLCRLTIKGRRAMLPPK